MQLFLIVLVVAICTIPNTQGEQRVGGTSKYKEVNNDRDHEVVQRVRKLQNEIKSESLKQVNNDEKHAKHKPTIELSNIYVHGYKTQLVNGINNFVKVTFINSDEKEFSDGVTFHIRIYQPFKGEPSLVRVKGPVSIEEEINRF